MLMCKFCGHTVSPSAQKCPVCGTTGGIKKIHALPPLLPARALSRLIQTGKSEVVSNDSVERIASYVTR